jgi:hypothetical protein
MTHQRGKEADLLANEAMRPIEPRLDDNMAHYAVTIIPSLPRAYPRQIGLTCGEYNARSVVESFGIGFEAEPKPRLRVRMFGLAFMSDLCAALKRHGLDANVRSASELHDESRLALLRGYIDSHEPVILAIGNGHLSRGRDSALARAFVGHFITIYGYDAEAGVFFVYDPYLEGDHSTPLPAGNDVRTETEILRDWNGPFYYPWIGMDHVYVTAARPD